MTHPPPLEHIEAARLHMERQHAITPDPLRDPRVMILELSEDQARPFAGLNECFAIVGRGSYPGFAGRLCLFAVPVSKELATAACRVAMGEARAVKLKAVSVEPRASVTPANTP